MSELISNCRSGRVGEGFVCQRHKRQDELEFHAAAQGYRRTSFFVMWQWLRNTHAFFFVFAFLSLCVFLGCRILFYEQSILKLNYPTFPTLRYTKHCKVVYVVVHWYVLVEKLFCLFLEMFTKQLLIYFLSIKNHYLYKRLGWIWRAIRNKSFFVSGAHKS